MLEPNRSFGFVGSLVSFLWSVTLLFAIPLIALKEEKAIDALGVGITAVFSNFLPLIMLGAALVLILLLSALPLGLGLFVSVPLIFCTSFIVFESVFFGGKADNLRGEVLQELESTGALEGLSQKLNTLQESVNDPYAEKINKSAKPPMPKNVSINRYDEYIQITRDWKSFGAIVILVFAAIFALVSYSTGDVQTLLDSEGAVYKLLLIAIVGLSVLYSCIGSIINKTHIYVSKEAIEVMHRPLPWFGNKRLEVENFAQLFVEQKITRRDNRDIISYDILILTKDHKRIPLLKGLKQHNVASYIEKEVEEYLGIVNNPLYDAPVL